MYFEIPILLLVFNRPNLTKIAIDNIRLIKPRSLFVAADGPRMQNEGDLRKCAEVRKVILESVDWECEVKTLYRDRNLGCGKAVCEAITWFFDHVEEGIILEDDCVPNTSFFPFCEELLRKYRNDDRISAVSGNNFLPIQSMATDCDYYFSVFPSSWGWATWRRSWQGFDLHISSWKPAIRNDLIPFLFHERKFQLWWKNQFDLFYSQKLEHTWDFQFHYLSMSRKQLAILPRVNLVSNIGHGPDATHFSGTESHLANLPTYRIESPLKHPSEISRNYDADIYHQELLFGEVEIVSPFKQAKRIIKQVTQRYRWR